VREIVKREAIEISVGLSFTSVLWCRLRRRTESMPVVGAGDAVREGGVSLRAGSL
jgi:hypothetical protein